MLLDLKRDRYFGAVASPALLNCIQGLAVPVGWSGSAQGISAPIEPDVDGTCRELLADMLKSGMLMPTVGHASSAPVRTIEMPAVALIEGYTSTRSSIRAADVASFLLASAAAAVLLRWTSLATVVARLRRRLSPYEPARFDEDEARSRVATFNRLRPWLYTANNACLFHSLAMAEYLARYGLCPSLVFGVVTNPFKAHCWLQHRSTVINDTPEYVREYTPILIA